MNVYVIGVFSFLAATSFFLVIARIAAAVQNSAKATIRRRLTTISRHANVPQAEIDSVFKSELDSEVPWLQALLARWELVRALRVLLERANVDLNVGQFFLCSLFIGLSVAFFAANFGGLALGLALAAGATAATAPYLYIKRRCRKRRKAFLEQLPDGLDRIGQGLQAGMGMTQALVLVAREMPDPLGTEFSIFMEELNLGLPLADALKNVQERMPLTEIRIFSTALLVQREVGGSLAELLARLADMIRQRFRLERLVKSLTAQNRISAWTVCSLPPLVALYTSWMDPVKMREVWTNPIGRWMMLGSLALEVVGIFAFSRLLKLRF